MQTFNFLNPNEIRKVTRSNIASLFASLMHLNSVINPTYKQRLLSFLGMVYNRILVIFDANARETISELKLVRRWYLDFLRGAPSVNPGLGWDRWDPTSSTPVLLEGIHSLWEDISVANNPDGILTAQQILFTLLSVDRIIVVPARPDHSSITQKPDLGLSALPTDSEIQLALDYLCITPELFKVRYAENVHNFEYEVISSKGPNGDSTWTAHLDARAWRNNLPLLAQFTTFLEESGLVRILKDLIGCIRSPAAEVIPNLNPLLGKLGYIEEWGGKSRIVAQLDYWTQVALTPLHNTINSFLRTLVQDGTFDQHSIAERVRQWTSNLNNEVFCFDLTSATDRLPISLQQRILTYLFRSSSMSFAWASVLTGRTFLTCNGDYIQYLTGQPMGARSSFPMLALTHHVIITIAAMRAGQTVYTDWAVLGDDSAMLGQDVAIKYQELMNALGVPINLTKSITHVPDALPMAEICKRIFLHGVEISRFNPKLLVNTIRDGRLGPDLQNDLVLRGWNPTDAVFWDFMAGILSVDHLTTLIRLNAAPHAISGLTRHFKSNSAMFDFGKWVPEFPTLTAGNIIQLFTYITASEALKRLDALLRATVTISDSIAIIAVANASPDKVPSYVRDDWLNRELSPQDSEHLTRIIGSAGFITPNHPIVQASRAESNRISELLHQLNAQDSAMVERARLGLLDTFRTAMSSIWLDNTSRRVGENRAIFAKTLTALVSLFTSDKRIVDGKRNLKLSYSVVLTQLSRLWTISLTLGGVVQINALRSIVTRNVTNATLHLSKANDASLLFDPKTKPTTVATSNPTIHTSQDPSTSHLQKSPPGGT
nr:MAG: putative RNA-dependent RNA polymerase [Mitoviridae sp.]